MQRVNEKVKCEKAEGSGNERSRGGEEEGREKKGESPQRPLKKNSEKGGVKTKRRTGVPERGCGRKP